MQDRNPDKSLSSIDWMTFLKFGLIGALLCLMASWLTEMLFLRIEAPRFAVLFADPALTKPLRGIPFSDFDKSRLSGDGEWQALRARFGVYTPIVCWGRRHVYHEADGSQAYVTPDLSWSGQGRARFDVPRIRNACVCIAALLCGLGTALLFTRPWSLLKIGAGVLLLRTASLFWQFGLSGLFAIHSNDESTYLAMAKILLSGVYVPGQYDWPIGLPILYLPVLSMFPQIGDFGFATLFSGVSFIVFGLGTIAVLLCLLSECGLSLPSIRAAGLAVSLLPWLTFYLHGQLKGVISYVTLWGRLIKDSAEF